MTVVVRCNLGWGELARGGLKCGWKELGFRLTPRPSLLFTVEVDYELHIKNGRIAVNYNHTTPRPVRRKSASELEDAAEAAHAAAKAAGRRLSDENVATESICESQCDSSWNFFYKNWLTSSYFMVCYTTNYSEANVWQQCSASLSFPLTIFSSTRTYGSISPFIRTRRQTTAESMRPNAHFAWRVSSGARNPTRSNSTITLRPRALSPRSMRLSVGTTLKRKVKLSVRIAGPI
mmetsp:Transcript_57915/g.159940  ORF Transcript_57915/g.159940 Transcript_57915/m.159940 type:complete len:234 (-) Transcript_57915:586-1287(-)